MGILFTILTVLFIAVSIALVLVILVQRPQGGGLASAFGGGGGTDTAFGGRTGDALTVATVALLEKRSLGRRPSIPEALSPEMPQLMNFSRICGKRVA
jgi:protein translocase SecG subunit